MNATRRDLEIQFRRVVANGWLSWFQREAKRAGTTTSHLLGIGSRETNLKNIRGDYRNGRYNGFGVMQVDIGTDPEYARNWKPENVEPSIQRGVDIYLSKVRDTQNSVGKKVAVRGRWFTGKAVETDDLRRVATAAYNCGRWAHWHFTRGEHVDSTTTGDDYSRDVYDRAVEFADMLEEQGYEKQAIHRELGLQGKYARKSHREQFGFYEAAERSTLPAGNAQEGPDELSAADYGREESGTDSAVDVTPPEGPSVEAGPTRDRADTERLPVTQPPTSQVADQITNIETGNAESTFVAEDKTIEGPPKDGATATATKTTILGIGVPAGLYAFFQGVQDWVEKGFIDVKEVAGVLLELIRNNVKYVSILAGLIISVVVVKKIFKQITFIAQMFINANPNWHNVKVVPNSEPTKPWWAFWR